MPKLFSIACRAKIAAALKGKPKTEKHRARLSASLKGRPNLVLKGYDKELDKKEQLLTKITAFEEGKLA